MAEAGWMESATAVARGFYSLPAVKQLGLLIGLSMSIALGFAVVLWSQAPDYRPLYSHMDTQATRSIAGALDQAGIDYKIENRSGSVMVASNKVSQARLLLAQSGLPKAIGSGFEVLSKEQNFGSSRFIETARYWHALEGELSRTITSFDAVRAARVHLAVPKSTVFVSDKRRPSASVLVDLSSGMRLEKEQVDAIVQMVAASVQDLNSQAVTVVDSQGRLLSSEDSDSLQLSRHQLDYKRQVEESFSKHIEAILMPILGHDKARAQVTADIDFTQIETTQERFDPEASVVRSEQASSEDRVQLPESAAVVGLLSQVAARESSPAVHQSTKTFEVSKHISHSTLPVGKLNRLSVAVVVDDVKKIDLAGNTVSVKLAANQIQDITQLVKNAVGYNESRGDSVIVINSAFVAPEAVPPMVTLPLWQQHWFWDVVKTIAAGVFLLILLLFFVKPILNALASPGQSGKEPVLSPGLLSENAMVQDVDIDSDTQVMRSARDLSRLQQQGQWTALKKMAAEDPKRIAEVMRTWVGDESR